MWVCLGVCSKERLNLLLVSPINHLKDTLVKRWQFYFGPKQHKLRARDIVCFRSFTLNSIKAQMSTNV